jgi:hypothetical protein
MRCPRCWSDRVAETVYGPRAELEPLILTGRVFHGGPLPVPDAFPHLGCLECGETWKPSRVHLHRAPGAPAPCQGVAEASQPS